MEHILSQIDLTEVAAKVLVWLILFGVAFGLNWLRNLAKAKQGQIEAVEAEVRARLGDKIFQQLIDIAHAAVLAAEQSGLVGTVKKTGEQKKALALDYAQNLADQAGLKVDVKQLDVLVESQVYSALTRQKPAAPDGK